MQSYSDNFFPVLRPAVPVIHPHTAEQPFCPDSTCPCHELDEASIAQVHQWYREGIITAQDATDIIIGRRSW